MSPLMYSSHSIIRDIINNFMQKHLCNQIVIVKVHNGYAKYVFHLYAIIEL